MKISATCIAVFCLMVGTPIGANFIDDIILRNWKGKDVKHDDPFVNPFDMSFPLLDMADDPMTGFMKEGAAKEARRKEARKSKLSKPWFSISEFLTLPEMSRKTNSEGRKPESGLLGGNTAETAAPNDKITPQGGLVESKSTLNADGAARQKRNTENPKFEDHLLLDRQHRIDVGQPENQTDTKKKMPSKFSFPKGFSDILIIFQKVGPKPKSLISSSPNVHECDEFCRNGVCEMRGPWKQNDEIEPGTSNTDMVPPEPTKTVTSHHRNGSLFGHYHERIFVLVIPIALGIGTVLFIIELRKIFRKMKKQSMLSTFDNQEC